MPRLVGVEAALSMVLSGTTHSPERFEATELVDALVEGDLLAQAVAFAHRSVAEARPLRRTRDLPVDVPRGDDFFPSARARATAQSKGMPAPARCVDAMEAAVRKPFFEGLAYERTCFDELLATPESKALRHVFSAQRLAAKIPDVPAQLAIRPIRRVGVIGAGTMGGGIATAFLNAGIPVLLLDARQDALDGGVATIRRNSEGGVRRGRLSSEQYQQTLRLLTTTRVYADLYDVDLVVEAVFEDLSVKEQVFRDLDAAVKDGAILATNTSTLDVDRIAAFTRRAHDVVGLHFFSPAHVMKLLEIVRGAATSKDVLATAVAVAKRIGKTAVVSRVCDGFIGNRMLQAYFRQAMFLLDEGALPAQVDDALETFGMAMGPFRVGDLAGNDIGWAVRKRLRVERPALAYSGIADRLCDLGRFGQKAGKGWYRYEAGSRRAEVDPDVTGIIERYRAEYGMVARAVRGDEIVERCILALVNEGARVLEEGIAQRASDIDVVYVTGYGFPARRGGPMFYAGTFGLAPAVRAMRRFAAEPNARARGDREFWQPAAILERLVVEGTTFHGPARSL